MASTFVFASSKMCFLFCIRLSPFVTGSVPYTEWGKTARELMLI